MRREWRVQSGWMSRFVAIMVLPLAVHALYATGQKALESYHLTRRAAELGTEIEQLKQTNLRLQRQIALARSDAEIERLAREQLGLVKPGDRALAVLSPDGLPAAPPTPSPGGAHAEAPRLADLPVWKQWWQYFFGPDRE